MKQNVTNVLVHVAWQVHAYAVLESVPRTAWAISWAVRSGMAYTAMAAHPVRAHTLCEIILLGWACCTSAACMYATCQSLMGMWPFTNVAHYDISYLQDHNSAEYRSNLAQLHEVCARRLLNLCQANGGVYIKAAQLITTAQAAPAEYRRCSIFCR